MSLLLASVAVALALVMVLSLYRVVSGPSIFDRLTGLGLIGSKTIVLLIVLGAWSGRVELYVDIALAYGLISFVGTLVLAKYFEVTTETGRSPGGTPRPANAGDSPHVGHEGAE